MNLNYKRREICVSARRVSFLGKVFGLMFRTRNTGNLLFENVGGMSLHSFFVFFDFLVLWIDDKNKVVDFRIVKPFSVGVKSKKRFTDIVEIPLNKQNVKIIRFFVGKRKV